MEQATPSADVPGVAALETTVQQFRDAFDPRNGGFGDAPKFPRPSELLFLMREHARAGAPQSAEMVLRTLRAMALGGMRDHIGGGFHRYSVDGGWRVPHFEKMLYDQAQLVLAFVEAAQVSGDPFYVEVAEDTLQYVMDEMTDERGGFYSAEDADSVPPEDPGVAHWKEASDPASLTEEGFLSGARPRRARGNARGGSGGPEVLGVHRQTCCKSAVETRSRDNRAGDG